MSKCTAICRTDGCPSIAVCHGELGSGETHHTGDDGTATAFESNESIVDNVSQPVSLCKHKEANDSIGISKPDARNIAHDSLQ